MHGKIASLFLVYISLLNVIQYVAGQNQGVNVDVTIIKPRVNDTCGINTGGPLVQQLSSTVSYLGGIFWADNGNKIVYTGRYDSVMGRYTPDNGHFNRGRMPVAEEYTFACPIKNAVGLRFVLGQDRRLVLNIIDTTGANQEAEVFNLLTITDNKQERVFVGKTSSTGTLWVSTGSANGLPIGKLYKIENLQKPVVMYEPLSTGAGMAWSLDDKFFYVGDSHEGVIYQFNYDKGRGTISNRKTVFKTSEHPDLGGVVGDLEVDNRGHLWISMIRGASVLQYDVTSRQILWQIAVPALDIVSLAFGNRDRRTLYVGTSKHFLTNTKDQPAAGALFSITGTGVFGGTHDEIVVPERYRSGSVLSITVIKPKTNDSCGISTGGPLVQQLTKTISYAGGLFWADNGNKIAYVDRYGSAFGRYTPDNGYFNYWPLAEANEYTAVFPVLGAADLRFIVGVDRHLELIYSTGTGENQTSNVVYLMTITNDSSLHVYKGRTDSGGGGWFTTGTSSGLPLGKVYKTYNLEEAVVMYDNLYSGAGMAWTKDDKYFYVVDSYPGVIYKFDYDNSTRNISNPTVVFNKSDHEDLGGTPFDIEVDTEGYLWIGMLHGGSVIQYDEVNKTIVWQIPVPASDVVSVEFGNHDKKTLYVGTANYYLPCHKKQPGAGAIYAISDTGAIGQTDSDYAVPQIYVDI